MPLRLPRKDVAVNQLAAWLRSGRMVEQRRRSTRRSKGDLLGNHQKCWLWGRNVVLETLRSGRWLPHSVFFSHDLEETCRAELQQLTQQLGVSAERVAHDRLTELCRTREHQGLAMQMPPFPYQPWEDVLRAAVAPQFFLLLDSIQDPFNFGALCRVACVFGVQGVVITSTSQVEVTSHVARSSAGAINRIALSQVDDLVPVIEQLKSTGIRVVAATLSATQPIHAFDFRQPTALIIGNEGRGIQPHIISRCDVQVRIPQATDFDSLNAAVAGGVLMYEVHRQRIKAG